MIDQSHRRLLPPPQKKKKKKKKGWSLPFTSQVKEVITWSDLRAQSSRLNPSLQVIIKDQFLKTSEGNARGEGSHTWVG